MGLDMYLSARFYSSDYFRPKARDMLSAVLDMTIPGLVRPYRDEATMHTVEIELPVMYWRKANAIHSWFVREVQEGIDDCRIADVSTDKLRELRDLCVELLKDKNPEQAVEKLPPTDGFFFGSTNINEYFWGALQDTADALTKLLEQVDAGQLKGWDFYYRSSW